MDKEKEATLLKLESSKESNVCNAGPQPVLLHMNEYSIEVPRPNQAANYVQVYNTSTHLFQNLGEITSYLLHNRTTAEEETRVNSLPQADPLNNNGLYIFRMTNESDNRITTAFKAATEEVLTSYLDLVFYYCCNVLTLISYHRHYPNIANVTHCECKPALPMNVQVSWTRINLGRRFKCCPKYDIKQQCGVFGFLDYELPSDYYKELLYNEHWENQSLKHMLRNMG
ncbi:hypothetical protein Tco_0162872 [Tanacetum coccineum]